MGDVLEVDEIEEFVLDDGAAEGHTIGSGTLRVTVTELETGNIVAAHELIPVIHIGRALDGVGTGLGDGVDTTADEVGLADVIRRDDDLHFLDGVKRNGVAAAGEVAGETEVVVEVTAVDGEVGSTVVRTHEGHAVSAVRREPGHIGEAAADGRKGNDLAVVDIGSRTCLLGGELGRCSGDDDGLGKHLGIVRHLGVERIGLTQKEGDISVGNRLVTKAADLDRVRTARTHTVDGETAFGIRHGIVLRTGRIVNGDHGGADDGFAGSVRDLSVKR